jgi:hypothetical protein
MKHNRQKLVDRISYLASLISESSASDNSLKLPSQKNVSTSSSSRSRAELTALKSLNTKLENYLIYQDPVRSFTEESLEQQVQQHFEGRRRFYQSPILPLAIIMLLSAVLASLPYIIPNDISSSNKIALAISLFFFGTHCGNMWFFLTALRNFRKELRKPFRLLVIGIMLVGIVGAQFTIINLSGSTNFPWINYGGFLFLFPLSYIPLLLGMRLFAKRLNVISLALSKPIFLSVSILLPLILFALFANPLPGESSYFTAAYLGITFGGILISWTAAIAYATSKKLARHYARAMKLLAAAFGLIGLSSISVMSVLLSQSQLTPLALSLALTPVIIAEPLELLAGYTFKKHSSE